MKLVQHSIKTIIAGSVIFFAFSTCISSVSGAGTAIAQVGSVQPTAGHQVLKRNLSPANRGQVPGNQPERVLAAMMIGEARGEGEVGQLLVGEIALNRVAANTFYGANIVEVVFQRSQFSCFNMDAPPSAKLRQLAAGQWSGDDELDSSFLRALPLAQRLLAGERTGLLSRSARHYAAVSQVGTPPWASKAVVVLVYKNHTFWTGVD